MDPVVTYGLVVHDQNQFEIQLTFPCLFLINPLPSLLDADASLWFTSVRPSVSQLVR